MPSQFLGQCRNQNQHQKPHPQQPMQNQYQTNGAMQFVDNLDDQDASEDHGFVEKHKPQPLSLENQKSKTTNMTNILKQINNSSNHPKSK